MREKYWSLKACILSCKTPNNRKITCHHFPLPKTVKFRNSKIYTVEMSFSLCKHWSRFIDFILAWMSCCTGKSYVQRRGCCFILTSQKLLAQIFLRRELDLYIVLKGVHMLVMCLVIPISAGMLCSMVSGIISCFQVQFLIYGGHKIRITILD